MILRAVAALLACLPQTVPHIEQREIHEQGSHYRIDIKYPEIENGGPFNAAVRRSIDSLAESFRKEGEISMPESPADSYLKGSYDAAILKNGIVSVLLDTTEYTSGAAHPWDVMASINYDTRTCRVLSLSDFFRPGVDYLPRLSELAIGSLAENEFLDPDVIRKGAGPVESNFKVFTLTDTALVLHFPMYQVAAGAAGPQTVVIPLEKLAPLLRQR